MKKLLLLILVFCCFTASAQSWTQISGRQRFVTALGIPTRDTSAMTPADSSQVLIRPADSSLYVRYKRAWQKVGAGGGGISGSGTTNRIPKWTSSSALGNSSIVDSASSVAMTINSSGNVEIGTSPWDALSIPFDSKLSFGSSTYPLSISRSSAANLITTISDNYDVINTRIDFVMRNGSVNQNTPLSLLSTGNVGIGTTSPGVKLDVNGIARVTTEMRSKNTAANVSYFTFEENTNGNSATFISGDARATGSIGVWTNSLQRMTITSGGNALIGTTTDNGVDRLQVSGSMNVSARATAQNLSVTNNISVTNDINQGSGTTNANWTILANGTSNGWAGQMRGNYSTGQFEFYHRNNSPTFALCFAVNGNGGKGNTSFYDNAFIQGDGWLTVNGSTNNGVDKLQVVGSASMTGMKQAYLARTTTYTATTSDYLIDCTTGTFTVTLFAASGNAGRILIIKNSGTGTITVDGNGAETIDGATTQTLSTQWSRITIMCDGTNWKIISN